MITTMMNKKRGLTDSVSCPTMEIPQSAPNNLLKSGAKEERTKNTNGTPVGKGRDMKPRPNQHKAIALKLLLYVGAITESDPRPTGVPLKKTA